MTTASTTAPTVDATEPQWGLGDAAIGWFLGETIGAVGGSLLLAATGRLQPMGQAALDAIGRVTGHIVTATFTPLWMVAITEAFLWVGFLGVPLVVTRFKGNGIVRDLGLQVRPIDVPIGVVAGLASQFILVPALSYPWIWLLGRKSADLAQPAQDLAAKATDPLGAVLLVLIVAIGAPIVEEVFFRGLLQRSLLRRVGPILAVAGSGLFFGLTHFELLQLPALVGFGVVLGVLAFRSGRLGPGIFAHLSFNAVTVAILLAKAHHL
jgi:hypothetical protein